MEEAEQCITKMHMRRALYNSAVTCDTNTNDLHWSIFIYKEEFKLELFAQLVHVIAAEMMNLYEIEKLQTEWSYFFKF